MALSVDRFVTLLDFLNVANLDNTVYTAISPGSFCLQPPRGLAGVGQGGRVNSCKIVTKTALERQVWQAEGSERQRQVWASKEM